MSEKIGLDLEDRTQIFKALLPEEGFVDRRIKTFEDIEPESESNDEENVRNVDLIQAETTSYRIIK